MSWKDKLQQLFNGKPQFANAEEVERAIGFDRIRSQVWKMLDRMNMAGNAYYYPLDVYLDNGGLYTLISSEGLLYRADLTVVGDRDVQMGVLQLIVDFSTEVESASVVTRVFRQADGRYRWFSISATAFLNRVGEIDSTALFDSFIAHATATGEYPFRTIIHQGEKLRTGKADLLARDGYCYITSGLFDEDNELALVEIAALKNNPTQWGESIGYIPTAEPVLWPINERMKIPVYEKGIHVEISTAQERDVSAWFTVPYITKERMVMNEVVRNTLAQLAKDAGLNETETDEFVNDFGSRVDGTNQRANAPGAVARANVPSETAVVEPAAAEAADPAGGELVIDEAAVAAIAQHVLTSQAFQDVIARTQPQAAAVDFAPLTQRLDQMEQAINANFGSLDGRLATLEGEEEVRAEDMPIAPQTRVVYRPSKQSVTNQPSNGIFEDSSEELVVGGLSKLEGMRG